MPIAFRAYYFCPYYYLVCYPYLVRGIYRGPCPCLYPYPFDLCRGRVRGRVHGYRSEMNDGENFDVWMRLKYVVPRGDVSIWIVSGRVIGCKNVVDSCWIVFLATSSAKDWENIFLYGYHGLGHDVGIWI